MGLDLRELLTQDKNIVPIFDPMSATQDILDANSFLANYGSYVEEVAIVAKSENGRVAYPSSAAPSDPNYRNFFSDFSQLANDLGIKVSTFIYGFGDEYFGADPKYSIVRSGGHVVKRFVCPNHPSYVKYLTTIVREIMNYPIQKAYLFEFFYPRQEYCFCKRCLRTFAQVTGIPEDITFSEIQQAENIEISHRYFSWREEIITNAFTEMANAVKVVLQQNKRKHFGLTVPLDPETEWIAGARKHFGINVQRIVNETDTIAFHIMPFTPLYPDVGTEIWEQIVSQIQLVPSSVNKDLFVWGISGEDDLTWLIEMYKQIKTPQSKMYIRLDLPKMYSDKREIHRGLIE